VAALAWAGCGGGAPRHPAGVPARHVALIERRVERLRGLRFLHPVPVAVVSAAAARRAGLEDFRRSEPRAREAADEEELKLLALIGPRESLRAIAASVYGEQVAGFYDPRRRRLALVRGAGVDDLTLAHELTHALEDQHFDLDRLQSSASGDAAAGVQGLVEGDAMEVEERYAMRYPGALSFGQAMSALGQVAGATPLPGAVERELLFPYTAGLRYVGALVAAGHGWRLVNEALRGRPPRSTAEVIDPRRWLRHERPAAVGLPRGPGRGWRRLSQSTFGEADLRELLRPAAGGAGAAVLAATWRGGREALWRRGPLPDASCAAPCRRRDVLVIAVRAGDAAGRRGLAAALGAWVQVGLHGRPSCPDSTWITVLSCTFE